MEEQEHLSVHMSLERRIAMLEERMVRVQDDMRDIKGHLETIEAHLVNKAGNGLRNAVGWLERGGAAGMLFFIMGKINGWW